MGKSGFVRLGIFFGAASAFVAAACGSSDEAKQARCGDAECSDAGASGDASGGQAAGGKGGDAGAAGETNVSGSAGAGGEVFARGGGGAGDVSGAGSSGDAGAGGASSPPIECPKGTADCDDDPTDCETNTASDAINCGRCERSCGGTAACTNGLCAPTVILDPQVSSNWCGAKFSATQAYMITCWGNNLLSEVRTAPLEPGPDVSGTRIRSYTNVSVVALRGILIDGNDVYYGLEGSPSNLWKFPLDADDTTDVTLALTTENNIRFDDLQLVGDTYYWNDNDHTQPGVVVGATIYKRAKTDVVSTPLITGLGTAYNLQVTPTKLTFMEVRATGGVVHAYRAPIAGATTATIEDLGPAGSGAYMTKQGDYVYWTVKSATPAGKLRRLKYADDAAKPEDIATNLNLPEGLATDAEYAYFKQLDALYRVPLAGGVPEQLSPVVPANDAQTTQVFHVDDKYVYFAAGPTAGDSTVVRVAK